ncbi:amidase domain-containing protein [Streptomyces sp. NPDC001493]
MHVRHPAGRAHGVGSDALSQLGSELTADDSADTTGMPDAVTTDADGNLNASETSSGTVTTVSTHAQYAADISGGGTATWARAHSNSAHNYGNDCTNFASKSLNGGGGMDKKWGSRLDRHKDDYWWRNTNYSYWKQSDSWSMAYHLANFISRQATDSWHTNKGQVHLGDIVFYNWNDKGDDHPNGFKGISHASVVTKIDSHGNIYISQHSTNRKNYPLTSQRKQHPHMSTWIVTPFPWYE